MAIANWFPLRSVVMGQSDFFFIKLATWLRTMATDYKTNCLRDYKYSWKLS